MSNPQPITANPNAYVPPTPSNSIPQAPTPTPAVAPLDSTQMSATDSNGDNPYLASQMMSYMNAKMAGTNSLNTVRNALIASRFSSQGLTPQQISSLDPTTQAIINSGNSGLQDMYLQSVNDQIQGYSNSLQSNMQFIQTGYQQAISDAETQKTDAISAITAVMNAGGSPQSLEALKTLFPGSSDLIDSFNPQSQISGLGQWSTFTVNTGDQAQMGKLMNASAAVESQGSYTAVAGGKDPSATTALGKYQIVPADWFSSIINPETGKPLDPNSAADQQLFLNDPQLQDQAYQTVMGSLLKQYKTLPKAIAAYFGGQSAANAVGTPEGDTISDGNMNVNQYVSAVMSQFTGGNVSIGTGSSPKDQVQQNLESTNPTLSIAQQLVSGLIAPSMLSKRSTGAASYANIIAMAQKLDPGFNEEQAEQQYQYGSATQTQATQASLGYTVDTLQQLSSMSANIDRGDITFGNAAGQWLNYNGSDPATVAFVVKANGAVDDISAALGGGVSTDTKTAIAKTILNPTLGNAGFQAQIATNLGTIASRQVNIAAKAGQTADPTALSIFATAQNADYSAMQAAGLSDAQIQKLLLGGTVTVSDSNSGDND